MQGAGLPYLDNWQNFYIIAGTAAATLTGLMFVVITLTAGIESHVATLNAALSAFSTPTIVHFGVVLLIAGIFSAPWQAFTSLSLVLGLVGLVAAVYLILVVARGMRNVPDYQTPMKDWVWYLGLPLCSYILLSVSALLLPANAALALYLASAVVAALLFTGIHNAWDLVTFLAVDRSHPEQ